MAQVIYPTYEEFKQLSWYSYERKSSDIANGYIDPSEYILSPLLRYRDEAMRER